MKTAWRRLSLRKERSKNTQKEKKRRRKSIVILLPLDFIFRFNYCSRKNSIQQHFETNLNISFFPLYFMPVIVDGLCAVFFFFIFCICSPTGHINIFEYHVFNTPNDEEKRTKALPAHAHIEWKQIRISQCFSASHNMQRRKSECLSNHKKNEAYTKESRNSNGWGDETNERMNEWRKNCLSYEITMLTIVIPCLFRIVLTSTGYLSAIKKTTQMIFHSNFTLCVECLYTSCCYRTLYTCIKTLFKWSSAPYTLPGLYISFFSDHPNQTNWRTRTLLYKMKCCHITMVFQLHVRDFFLPTLKLFSLLNFDGAFFRCHSTIVSYGLKPIVSNRFRTIKTKISRWFWFSWTWMKCSITAIVWNRNFEWASRHIQRTLNYNYGICSNPKIMANSQLKWKWIDCERWKVEQQNTHTYEHSE